MVLLSSKFVRATFICKYFFASENKTIMNCSCAKSPSTSTCLNSMIVKKFKHKLMPFVRCTIKTYRRLCGGLKINDLVRCHPPRLDFIVGFCNASFIYHQKCLQHEMLHSFTLHKTMLSYKKNNKNLITLEERTIFLCCCCNKHAIPTLNTIEYNETFQSPADCTEVISDL